MSRRDTLVTVELVEADDPGPALRAARRNPRRRWWLLAVPVAVVAVVGAGVQLVRDDRLRAEDERVAALPGAVDPVGSQVLWRSEPAMAALADGLVAYDALHALIIGPDGTVSYDAVDLENGDELWSVPLLGPDPDHTSTIAPIATACATDAEPGTEPDRVVCLVTDRVLDLPGLPPVENARVSESRIVVLDLADGRVLADRPAPPVTTIAVLPGLVATAVVDDQHRVVVATDPLTGDELWRYREPDPVREQTVRTTSVSARGGMVALLEDPDHPVVLSPTGDRVAVERDAHAWGATTKDWWVTEHANGPHGRFQRVVRPGEPPVEVVGWLLDRTVDDGSAPGLEVAAGDSASGWDRTTGERLWRADVTVVPAPGAGVLIIDGVVYLSAQDAVVALDAGTGETLWTAARQQGSYDGELLTDGAHVILVEAPTDGNGPTFLTVLARRDGAFVHRLRLPDTVAFPASAGRHLVGRDRLGTVVRIG